MSFALSNISTLKLSTTTRALRLRRLVLSIKLLRARAATLRRQRQSARLSLRRLSTRALAKSFSTEAVTFITGEVRNLNEISDHALLNLLKRKIAKNPGDMKRMRSTFYCGSRVLNPGKGYEPGVFVLANNETARFWGTITCKNPWICPVCSARQMSKYATDVAVAIDALKERGQAAFMITFTVPHTNGMPCDETTEILRSRQSQFEDEMEHRRPVRDLLPDVQLYSPNTCWRIHLGQARLAPTFSLFVFRRR